LGLYDPGTCDAFCPFGLHSTPPTLGTWQVETNFIVKQQGAKALTLIQATDKINRAQANARKVLGKKGMNYRNVASLAAAIAAVDSLFSANPAGGKVHLMIIGHGSSGNIKVGETNVNNGAGAANQTMFEDSLKGKIANLTIFGCNVAKGDAGQAFVQKLAGTLAVQVKAYTQPVAADTSDFWVVQGSKKDVPIVDTRLIIVLSILLLAFGAWAVARSRNGRSEVA